MDEPRHHLFVSYAWVDDQAYADASAEAGHRPGWVSTFVDRLGKHLGRELGRATEGERYWLDYERMRAGGALAAEIRAQLAASRLLLPVVSKGWFASHWCRQELASFLALHPDGALGRLFPVWMEPVERADLAPEAQAAWDTLRQVLGCDLWYLDPDKQVRTRWFPDPDPTDRDYARLQQDLARGLAARIRALVAAEGGGDGIEPVPFPQPAPQPVPQPSPGPHPDCEEGLAQTPMLRGRTIVVIGGSEDAGLVQQVAECLARRYDAGYVIPLMAQKNRDPKTRPSRLLDDLRGHLTRCDAVLTVLRKGPADQVYAQTSMYVQATTEFRNGAAPPPFHLCRSGTEPILYRPSGMREHSVSEPCTTACVRAFVEALGAEVAP